MIFDLDGTLTESKAALTSEMGIVLARLLEQMPVAIMSGGSYGQFQKQLLANMPLDARYENLYLFPTSAAQCYQWRDSAWTLAYDNPLTDDEKARILAALDESLREVHLEQPLQLWGAQIEDRGSQITWSALGQEAPYDVKKTWDPDMQKRAPLRSALIKRLPRFSIRVNATSSIDITHTGINKAYGVQKLSELLDIPIADLLYVGDALFPGGNDEIVKETGIPTEQVAGPADTARAIARVLA